MLTQCAKSPSDCLRMQAGKADPDQPSISTLLPAFNPANDTADACIVGCGPAGLALAAELGAQGVAVVVVGMYARKAQFTLCLHPSKPVLPSARSLQHRAVLVLKSFLTAAQGKFV